MSESPFPEAVRHALLAALLVATGAPPAVMAQETPVFPIPEVHEVGSGERTLLLLPCFSCGWWQYEPFMERNAERYRMIAVTLPGYGGTELPELPLDTAGTPFHDNMVAALAQLLEERSIDQVVVVGHSFGGRAGLEFAAARPDLVSAYVNLDGGISSTRRAGASRDERLQAASAFVGPQREIFRDPMEWVRFNSSSIRDATRRQLHASMFAATPREAVLQYWRENFLIDLGPMLRGLSVPALDVETISPTRSDPRAARASHEEAMVGSGRPPNMKTVYLHETYHFMLDHRPLLVDELIAAFLAGEPVGDFIPPGWPETVADPIEQPLADSEALRYTGLWETVNGWYTIATAGGRLVMSRAESSAELVHEGDGRFRVAGNSRLSVVFHGEGSRAERFEYTSAGGGLEIVGWPVERR